MNAVISGASKGIGLAIAELFLHNNINVAICSRNYSELEQLKKKWQEEYPACMVLVFEADMSKTEEVKRFASYVKGNWEVVNILVNNAGVFMPGEILTEESGRLENQIETNLYSAYHLTRFLIDQIKGAKNAHIFNMCSVASIKAYPNGGSYSISKFALLGFSKVLREELKPKSIKVTSVLPGATWSNSWEGVDLPEDRLMQANDIAIAIYSAMQMSPAAVLEEIILRPQLGDL